MSIFQTNFISENTEKSNSNDIFPESGPKIIEMSLKKTEFLSEKSQNYFSREKKNLIPRF